MRHAGRVVVLLTALLLVACSQLGLVAETSPPRHLHLVLTNDDGVGAEGIVALRAALELRGHRISVVAPAQDRSGSGVSLTTRGSIRVRELEEGVWSVAGTPADCVQVALYVLFRDDPVDLVVSGVNFGQNIGARTVSSGTVGAAMTAVSAGVPAIAISQAVDPVDVSQTPRFFPDSADFAARLVGALVQEGADPLLPRGTLLNVNYPPRLAHDVAGVRLARQGRANLYDLYYARDVGDDVLVFFGPSAATEPIANADTTLLAKGYITITPLDGDWTAHEAVQSRFDHLAEMLGRGLRSGTASGLAP